VEGRTRQRIVATLGRLDRLQARGGVDALLRSLARFAEKVQLQEAYREGSLAVLGERAVGPALVFGRLWEELGIRRVLRELPPCSGGGMVPRQMSRRHSALQKLSFDFQL